jgi:hypothetical protein
MRKKILLAILIISGIAMLAALGGAYLLGKRKKED